MQDKAVTSSKGNDTAAANKSALKAAYARFQLLPITWRIVGGALVGLAVLGATAYFLPNMTERMKFFTESALAWLVFVVVAVQAYIYKQQAKIMGDALVIGHMAYVSIHSIESDMKTGAPIAIRIENVGKVPAEEIEVHIELACVVKPKIMNTPTPPRPQWYTRTQHFGRMKLFCGNFKIPMLIGANNMFFSEELDLIVKNCVAVVIRGRIGWQDGFQQRRQEVEFAFFYAHNAHTAKDEWLPSSPALWDDMFQVAYMYPARKEIIEDPN